MKKSETAELNFQLQARTELERNYKDTVFVTVFHEKAKLIELYNAIFTLIMTKILPSTS